MDKGIAMKHFAWALAFCVMLTLAGCTYYVAPDGTAVPGYPPPMPSTYDRSFSAAAGAMRDQGLAITMEDRATGTVVGNRDGATVTASLRTQADGSVRVQFDARNARDPSLVDRVSSSYDRRMGR
jgi:hypothetical protein